jgi:hypothetical protein
MVRGTLKCGFADSAELKLGEVDMLRLTKYSVCLLAATAFYAAPAYAQATRTWVSGVGDDVNPCSRTAPCKTFAGAISKTAAGGEIDCLDPGGFGAVTITKSLTIDCDGTFGSILASNTNGISVNDSASGFPNTARVVIRAVSINGAGGGAQNAQGNPGSGLTGINFVSGASLILEEVVIQRFNAGSAAGINFRPGGAATLSVQNSLIIDNGTGGTGGGIVVHPSGTGTAQVNIVGTGLYRNAGAGVSVDTTANTGAAGVTVVMDDVRVTNGNGQGISVVTPGGTTSAAVLLNNVTLSGNGFNGIFASGGTATVRVSDSTITGNFGGVQTSGGAQILTFGNNRLIGNPTVGVANNGAFSGPVPPS